MRCADRLRGRLFGLTSSHVTQITNGYGLSVQHLRLAGFGEGIRDLAPQSLPEVLVVAAPGR
jgi:hypothetical protein